jgi:hypothetical protein
MAAERLMRTSAGSPELALKVCQEIIMVACQLKIKAIWFSIYIVNG